MEVLRVYGDQDYWSIFYKDESYMDIEDLWYLAMYGKPVIKEWKKIDVEIVFRGQRHKIKPDFIDFGGLVGFAITSHTKDILNELLVPYCELLPLDLKGEELYLVNPTIILDCIDYDYSVIEVCPPMNRKKL